MIDFKNFDPNSLGNPNNNIFGLPTTEENSRLIILPVPWEVTVSYNAGTARAPDHLMTASLQVDLYDKDYPNAWHQGIFMRTPNQKILTKSDFLRKEAELYINYISQGEEIEKNKFMCKTLKDINSGGAFLTDWVYQQTKQILDQGKLAALLGGDHSTPLGFIQAVADKYDDFGILQIDAHLDLRKAYEGFEFSHASIMYNVMERIPQVKKLVQVGPRDFCDEEVDYSNNSNGRINTIYYQDIAENLYEGGTWRGVVDHIVNQLPQNVYLSFDIDGLKPNLCPHTGTPVHGGFEVDQVFYLLKKMLDSGRKLIAFDLNEVGVSSNEWDENVGARILYKLCNMLIHSNPE